MSPLTSRLLFTCYVLSQQYIIYSYRLDASQHLALLITDVIRVVADWTLHSNQRKQLQSGGGVKRGAAENSRHRDGLEGGCTGQGGCCTGHSIAICATAVLAGREASGAALWRYNTQEKGCTESINHSYQQLWVQAVGDVEAQHLVVARSYMSMVLLASQRHLCTIANVASAWTALMPSAAAAAAAIAGDTTRADHPHYTCVRRLSIACRTML